MFYFLCKSMEKTLLSGTVLLPGESLHQGPVFVDSQAFFLRVLQFFVMTTKLFIHFNLRHS